MHEYELHYRDRIVHTDDPPQDYHLLHRLDGPAHITDCVQIWYKNGQIHRVDGPAIIYNPRHPKYFLLHTYEEWFYEDKSHRIGGPSEMLINGGWSWYENGNLHREDGPASYYPNSSSQRDYQYYIYGEAVEEEVFNTIGAATDLKQLSLFLTSPSKAERYLAEKQLIKLKEYNKVG